MLMSRCARIAALPLLCLSTPALAQQSADKQEEGSILVVGHLLGLEVGQTAYDRGERFVQGIVERAGAEALSRLWSDERNLPTPSEVDAPGLWLARIDLPDAD